MKYQKKDLQQFSAQIEYALNNYKPQGLDASAFDNILLCGLGGSGIAGRIVKSYFSRTLPLPVEVLSGYDLPQYIGPRTLAIMCSYSGNTEETLSMYEEAKEKGAQIISMSTGGELEEKSLADGYPFLKAEAGFQPRMALGYSLTYLMLIFGELTGKDMKPGLQQAAGRLSDGDAFIQKGKEMFDRDFKDLLPSKVVVIADIFTNPIGVRFCQQLQENAKHEAFIHELPEMNHNVIETYYGKLDTIFLFLNSHMNKRTDLRFSFLRSLLGKENNNIIEMDIDPDSLISVLENIYILDWVSLWMADHIGVKSVDVKNIHALKDFLARN